VFDRSIVNNRYYYCINVEYGLHSVPLHDRCSPPQRHTVVTTFPASRDHTRTRCRDQYRCSVLSNTAPRRTARPRPGTARSTSQNVVSCRLVGVGWRREDAERKGRSASSRRRVAVSWWATYARLRSVLRFPW